MTYHIGISLYYFCGEKPAIADAPELGTDPHAQDVMRYYGITYSGCQSSSVAESWQFWGCDKAPENPPSWMSVRKEDAAG